MRTKRLRSALGLLVGASIIGSGAAEAFGAPDLFSLYLLPRPGVDLDQLERDLLALVDRRPDIHVLQSDDVVGLFHRAFDQVRSMLSGLLLVTIVAAALGVVNTTTISVSERRRELGLLRAVGATRRQVSAVVAGEAALMGLVGGSVGLVAGLGFTVILATVYGGNSFGFTDLDLWGAALRSVQPALLTGGLGLVAAPLVCAGAAWGPARSILRGSAIETMEAERQQAVSPRRAVIGFLSRGSMRTRFVLGTGILMAVVLAGLIAVVTTHARVRMEEQTHDALRTMVTWNAGMIELGLPDDAETLDLNRLQAGEMFDFDADTLLRFERLMIHIADRGKCLRVCDLTHDKKTQDGSFS